MTFRSPSGRLTTTLLLFLLAATTWGATDRRKFSNSPTLAAEANALLQDPNHKGFEIPSAAKV